MGGMGGMGGRSREPANTTEYYETLGVSKDATKGAIKKAYFKLCKTHHPDKGGDAEQFKKITEAYEALYDEEKRAIYDKYGKEGLTRAVTQSSSRRSRRPMRPCMTRRSVRSMTSTERRD